MHCEAGQGNYTLISYCRMFLPVNNRTGTFPSTVGTLTQANALLLNISQAGILREENYASFMFHWTFLEL